MVKIIREKILKLLKSPLSVSEIKNKLPEVSSFGTIAYHLKMLEEEGLIKKKKFINKRGKPTYYSLKNVKNIPNTQEDLIQQYEKNTLKERIRILKLLKESPREDDFIHNVQGINVDTPFDLVSKGYSELKHFITPQGEKFLKENSK